MDALTLALISIVLALGVLVENTFGLWKIIQGVKAVQDGQRELHKMAQEGSKSLQAGQKAIMEALERIKASK